MNFHQNVPGLKFPVPEIGRFCQYVWFGPFISPLSFNSDELTMTQNSWTEGWSIGSIHYALRGVWIPEPKRKFYSSTPLRKRRLGTDGFGPSLKHSEQRGKTGQRWNLVEWRTYEWLKLPASRWAQGLPPKTKLVGEERSRTCLVGYEIRGRFQNGDAHKYRPYLRISAPSHHDDAGGHIRVILEPSNPLR